MHAETQRPADTQVGRFKGRLRQVWPVSDRTRQARRMNEAEDRRLLDPWVVVSALSLIALGFVMVVSSSISVADRVLGDPWHYAVRQGIFLLIGTVGALIALRFPMDWLQRLSRLGLIVAVMILLLVFVPGLGVRVNGSLRWINLGVANFQVAEAVKLLLVIYLAGYLVRQQSALEERFMTSVKALGVSLLLALLLLCQPDYGTAVLLVAISAGMIWLAGARLRYLFTLGLTVVPIMASAALMEPYRLHRLTSFLNPWADPFDGGFQLTQALIAVGRGEWFGVGLGASVQKLFYLPEAHTDFIFAVIAEELGLLGVMLVLTLFAILVGRALWLGFACLRAERPFAGYLAYGIGIWIALQVLISAGVNLGILPTKGLTLPFISYGGSSLVVMCAAVGLLLRVAYELGNSPAAIANGYSENARPRRRNSRTSK